MNGSQPPINPHPPLTTSSRKPSLSASDTLRHAPSANSQTKHENNHLTSKPARTHKTHDDADFNSGRVTHSPFIPSTLKDDAWTTGAHFQSILSTLDALQAVYHQQRNAGAVLETQKNASSAAIRSPPSSSPPAATAAAAAQKSSACEPKGTLADGAAAWMCSKLEELWEFAAKHSATPASDGCVRKAMDTVKVERVARETDVKSVAEEDVLLWRPARGVATTSSAGPSTSSLHDLSPRGTRDASGTLATAAFSDVVAKPTRKAEAKRADNDEKSSSSSNNSSNNSSSSDEESCDDNGEGEAMDWPFELARTRARLLIRLLALHTLHKHQRRKQQRKHRTTEEKTQRQRKRGRSRSPLPVPASVPVDATVRRSRFDEESVKCARLVQVWVWQRAAVLPRRIERFSLSSPPALTSSSVSPFPAAFQGDLAALLVEWCALEVVDGEESCALEQQKWKMFVDAQRRKRVSRLTTNATTHIRPTSEGTGKTRSDTHDADLSSAAHERDDTAVAADEPVSDVAMNSAAPRDASTSGMAMSVTEMRMEDEASVVPATTASCQIKLPSREEEEVAPVYSALLVPSTAETVEAAPGRVLRLGAATHIPPAAAAVAAGAVSVAPRRLTLRLFSRPSADPAAALSTGDGKADEMTEVDVNNRDRIGWRGEEATRGTAPTFTAVANDDGTGGDAVDGTAQMYEQDLQAVRRETRRAQWRRVAPFVFYAPRGSRAERQMGTVLAALGYAEGRETPSPHREDEEENESCSTPVVAKDTEERTPKTSNSRRSSRRTPRAKQPPSAPPLCPLGRLPPLVAAYAWMHVAPLRTKWFQHMLVSHPPLALSSAFPHVFETPPGEKEGGTMAAALARTAAPLSCEPAASTLGDSNADRSCRMGRQLMKPCGDREGVGVPSTLLPCVAYADRDVAAALDDLCRTPFSVSPEATTFTTAAAHNDSSDPALAASRRPCSPLFCFSNDFESRLYAYLCYPLAGVAALRCDQQGRRIPTRGEDACGGSVLSLAAWEAYLELRFGAYGHHRKAAHSKAGHAQKDENVDGQTRRTQSGALNNETLSSPREDEPTRVPDQRESVGNKTLSFSSFAAAAASAAKTAAASAPASSAYTAVLDVAAALLLAELQQTCRRVVTCEVDVLLKSSDTAANSSSQAPPASEKAEAQTTTLAAEGQTSSLADVTENACARGGGVAQELLRTERLARGDGDSFHLSGNLSALQVVLEGVVETDPCLASYMRRELFPSENALRCGCPPLAPASGAAEFVADSCRPNASTGVVDACVKSPGAHICPTQPDANTQGSTCTHRSSTTIASDVVYASQLWLALLVVLGVGESAVAQYVRSVLLSTRTAHAPAWTGTTTTSSSQEASLAPFSMPTLFRSSLEDLVREEAVLRARPPPQLCRPSVAAGAALLKDGEEMTNSVAVAAAVALRHPRLLLPQLRQLWVLSNTAVVDDTASTGDKERATRVAQREAFAGRVGSVLECIHLASCAGVAAPVATTFMPTGDPLGEAASTHLHHTTTTTTMAATTAAPVSTSTSSTAVMDVWTSTQKVPCENVGNEKTGSDACRKAGEKLKEAASQSGQCAVAEQMSTPAFNRDDASNAHAPATQVVPRPRLQLRLPATTTTTAAPPPPAGSAAVTTAEFASAFTAQKRSRSPLTAEANFVVHAEAARSTSTSAFAARREVKVESDVDASRGAAHDRKPDLPALDGVTEMRVRWGCEVRKGIDDAPRSKEEEEEESVLLSTLLADLLLRCFAHLRAVAAPACVPCTASAARVAGVTSIAGAAVSEGDNPSASAPFVTAEGAQGARQSAPSRSSAAPRRTLSLRLAPAFAELQQLWQVLQPSSGNAAAEKNQRARDGGHRLTLSVQRSAASTPSVLQVVLPQLSSSPSSALTDRSTTARTGAPALARRADLRCYDTVVAAVRGVLCCAVGYAVYAILENVEKLWKHALGAESLRGGAADVSAAQGDADNVAGTSEDRDCLDSSYRKPSHGLHVPSPLLQEWLLGELRRVHDDVLQPLNRIFKVTVPTTTEHQHQAPSSPVRTAAWLSYKPLSRVLFPEVMMTLEHMAAHHLEGTLSQTSDLERRNAALAHDLREAWERVRASLLQAGVGT